MAEALAEAIEPIVIYDFHSQPEESLTPAGQPANDPEAPESPYVSGSEPEIVAYNAALVAIASIVRSKSTPAEMREAQLDALRAELLMIGMTTAEFRVLYSAAMRQPAVVGRAIRDDGIYNRRWHS